MYFKAILRLKLFSIFTSPDENVAALVHMLDFWVNFRLKIPLMLYCGFNFVKKYRWCHIVDQFLQKNCIDVTLLVKILPEKNCIVIVVLLRTHIATPWSHISYLRPRSEHFIPAGMKWSISFRPEWSISFRPEWNGPFHSGQNGMAHFIPAGTE